MVNRTLLVRAVLSADGLSWPTAPMKPARVVVPVRRHQFHQQAQSARPQPVPAWDGAVEVTLLRAHIDEVGCLQGAGHRLSRPEPLQRRPMARRRGDGRYRTTAAAQDYANAISWSDGVGELAQRDPAARTQQPSKATQGRRRVRQKEQDETGEHRIERVRAKRGG